MKKIFVLTFSLLFLGVGIACATDFSLFDPYHIRETYDDILGSYDPDEDGSLNFSNSSIFFGDSTSVLFDNDIVIEHVLGGHTFENGSSLTIDLTNKDTWATSFGDYGADVYRAKYTLPLEYGMLLGLVKKVKETGKMGDKEAGVEKDKDVYAIGLASKMGDLNVKSMISYAEVDSELEAANSKEITYDLGIDGTFKSLMFESEFIYRDTDAAGSGVPFKDSETWGAYLNLWMNVDALRFGILGAYGSYDEDAGIGFDFGPEFLSYEAYIMSDDIYFTAAQVLAIYFDYSVNEKLAFGGYFGYGKGSDVSSEKWDDATIWEISADASYSITPSLKYSVAAAIAELEWGEESTTSKTDEALEISSKLSFSF